MRYLKFSLLFLSVFLISTLIAVYIVWQRIPEISSNKAILVLGKGGEGHTAPNLTDTIMVVFLSLDPKKVDVLSLPRDLWITEIRAKINTAYHYGGFKMASDSITSVTNKPINNTVVVDFSLFKDLIDSMDGIIVNIDNSFVDERYPIAGFENDLCDGDTTYACRYETLQFEEGMQKMNGELALKFVRSRNAENDEGTDLARGKRQQKVIEAVKEKLLSREILFNPKKIRNMYQVLAANIETDLDKDSILSILKFIIESDLKINFLNIPDEILKVSQGENKYDRQYVFVPTSGSWQEFHDWLVSQIKY